MGTIVKSVRHGFSNLTNFSGRDTRHQFWPYASAVIGGAIFALAIFVLGQMPAHFAKVQAYAEAHPENVTVTSTPGSFSIEVRNGPEFTMPDMSIALYGANAACLLAVVLLAAAVARRLHDTGRSGFWGLAPLPFAIASLALVPAILRMIETNEVDWTAFFLLVANNMAYPAILLGLAVLLSKDGEPHENRYGAPSAS